MSRETIKKNRKRRARWRMQAKRDDSQLRMEQQRAEQNRRDEVDMNEFSINVYPVPKEWLKQEAI